MSEFSLISHLDLETKPRYRSKLREIFDTYLASSKGEGVTDFKEIVSIGCGNGYESAPLLKLFPGTRYVGVDNNSWVINRAKALNQDTAASFIVADGADPEIFNGTNPDLILIRNLDPRSNIEKGSFAKIFKNAFVHLAEDGVIYASAFNFQDMENVVREMIELEIPIQGGPYPVESHGHGIETAVIIGRKY